MRHAEQSLSLKCGESHGCARQRAVAGRQREASHCRSAPQHRGIFDIMIVHAGLLLLRSDALSMHEERVGSSGDEQRRRRAELCWAASRLGDCSTCRVS